MRIRFPLPFVLPLSCALLLSCGGQPAPVGSSSAPVGSSQAPVVGGTLSNADLTGFVNLTTPTEHCTGTLITNNWALTAAHCITGADIANPNQVTARTFAVSGGHGYSSYATVVVVDSDTNVDVALIKFMDPFPLFGSNVGSIRILQTGTQYFYSTTQTVTCFGYGYSDLANTTGSGTLRSASFDAWSDSDPIYLHVKGSPTDGTRALTHGDSGGACVNGDAASALGQVVGITHGCMEDSSGTCPDPLTGQIVMPDNFTAWMTATMLNNGWVNTSDGGLDGSTGTDNKGKSSNGGGGCSVARTGEPAGTGAWLFAGVLALLAFRRRRDDW